MLTGLLLLAAASAGAIILRGAIIRAVPGLFDSIEYRLALRRRRREANRR